MSTPLCPNTRLRNASQGGAPEQGFEPTTARSLLCLHSCVCRSQTLSHCGECRAPASAAVVVEDDCNEEFVTTH